MDVKSVNTAGWREPQKRNRFSRPEEENREMVYFNNQSLLPYSEEQSDINTFPTTMDWLLTWRKVINNDINY